jgi:hypothetical protein
MDLLKACEKGKNINSWENYYIQEEQMSGHLMEKQNTQQANPLFQLGQTYTIHNRTIRHASASDLASTHLTGIT